MRPAQSGDFSAAREQKRVIFVERWNLFIRGKSFLAAMVLLLLAQTAFLILSHGLIDALGTDLGLFPVIPWQRGLLIFAVQMVLSLPGFLNCIGLFLIRRKAIWEQAPNLVGVRLLRWVNYGVIAVTGAALALYPTVIISVGDYYVPADIYRIAYLFICSTLLMLLCVILLRPVLRMAEENIACCWSEQKFVLPLLITLLLIGVVILFYAPLNQMFFVGMILLILAYSFLLWIYFRFLRRVSDAQGRIDRAVISKYEDPDDPYNRY